MARTARSAGRQPHAFGGLQDGYDMFFFSGAPYGHSNMDDSQYYEQDADGWPICSVCDQYYIDEEDDNMTNIECDGEEDQLTLDEQAA